MDSVDVVVLRAVPNLVMHNSTSRNGDREGQNCGEKLAEDSDHCASMLRYANSVLISATKCFDSVKTVSAASISSSARKSVQRVIDAAPSH
jgi:hypothetical protein